MWIREGGGLCLPDWTDQRSSGTVTGGGGLEDASRVLLMGLEGAVVAALSGWGSGVDMICLLTLDDKEGRVGGWLKGRVEVT